MASLAGPFREVGDLSEHTLLTPRSSDYCHISTAPVIRLQPEEKEGDLATGGAAVQRPERLQRLQRLLLSDALASTKNKKPRSRSWLALPNTAAATRRASKLRHQFLNLSDPTLAGEEEPLSSQSDSPKLGDSNGDGQPGRNAIFVKNVAENTDPTHTHTHSSSGLAL